MIEFLIALLVIVLVSPIPNIIENKLLKKPKKLKYGIWTAWVEEPDNEIT